LVPRGGGGGGVFFFLVWGGEVLLFPFFVSAGGGGGSRYLIHAFGVLLSRALFIGYGTGCASKAV